MKKDSIPAKIGLLMVLAVSLLSATGYLSYRNLSSIVSSIHVEVKPDLRLLSIREISMDLEKAENSVRIYSITNDTLDLKPYYIIISNIDDKVSRLKSECLNDSILLEQADTISNLIEENIIIWNELLYLNNNYKVTEYLKQLSDQLNNASENERNMEKGILKRVFRRSNKSQLDQKELINNLKKIEQQDRIKKEKLMTRESQLAITGNEIKSQFYDLITKMESQVSRQIKEKEFAANILAAKTYRWLAMFTVLGTLLAILVLFIIVRYVRKTYASQLALENSKNEAENLVRTKEQFMANMSHEIRTPVTAISGFTEQLLHESFDLSTTRTLKMIKSSSDHLAIIIDDILDFSKLQNGKLLLEKVHFNISQILEDIYVLFERQAQKNNTVLSYSLSPDIPEVLLGDPHRLKQIIINLVSNSVKFTREGEVFFTVKANIKNSPEFELIIEVTDTGIGIDESKLDFIFEDFTQAEMSTTREYGGTGLGLSIVRKIVELHHGRIECNSKKGQGTKITCYLPYLIGDVKQLKMDDETPFSIPEEIQNLKILIVDDEEYNRHLFKTILGRWKIEYYEAVNGIYALEMIKSDHFDMVFMDVRMPGIDGLTATQYIRDNLKIKESEMPIVCISAASINEDWPKYKKAGMNAFLKKPFTEKMLLTVILSLIQTDIPITTSENRSNEKINPDSEDKINLHNLYHISDGDEKFVKQMLLNYIDTTKQGLKDMHEAVNTADWESAANLAHKMLPPCQHVGATNLYNYLKRIEENIRKKTEMDTIKSLTRDSIKEFEVISKLLNLRISKIN